MVPLPSQCTCRLASGVSRNQDSRFRMGVPAYFSGAFWAGDRRGCAYALWYFLRRRCGNSFRVARRFISASGIITTFAPAYFAAAEIAAREAKVGIIILEVARPDFPVADRKHVCRYRSQSRSQRAVCHFAILLRSTQTRLCGCAGVEFDGQSGQGIPASDAGRRERQSHCRH